MHLLNLYWGSIIVSAAFYVLYWFSPYTHGSLSPDIQGLLSYNGFESWIELPGWLLWSMFIVKMTSYAGIFLFRKLFRLLFLIIFLFGIIILPFTGASVITGLEAFVIDSSTALSGFILAMALFSPLKDKFY